MKMHAWTEDYQDRFLKRTVVAWWFADMQVSYTHFVRRWICLLKILSSWIIHKNILALSVETFPVPLTLGLRTSRTSLSLNALDRNRFGVPGSGSERFGGAYPLQFWGSKIWLAVVPATSLPQNPHDVRHGSNPLVEHLSQNVYTLVLLNDTWSWGELPGIEFWSQNFTVNHIILNTSLANLNFIYLFALSTVKCMS